MAAGITNFEYALEHGVMPARSYYTLIGSINEEATAPDINESSNRIQYEADLKKKAELLERLTTYQRLQCAALQKIRLFEKGIYDRKVKNMA